MTATKFRMQEIQLRKTITRLATVRCQIIEAVTAAEVLRIAEAVADTTHAWSKPEPLVEVTGIATLPDPPDVA